LPAQDYPAPAIAWRLEAASAPVLAHAVSACAHTFKSTFGFEYSLLAGTEWVYLWPRLPMELGGFEPAQHLAGAFAAPQKTPPELATPGDGTTTPGGKSSSSSSSTIFLDGATGDGLEARLAKGAPPAEDLELAFAHCAGATAQTQPATEKRPQG
jgi:hypothetical protein